MSTKPKYKTIRIPAELFDTVQSFFDIAGIDNGFSEMVTEDFQNAVDDSLKSSAPDMMNGLCDFLLNCYDYSSEAEKDRVEAELWAEVCRRRPRAEIIPFPNLAPRMVVG